MDSVFRVVDNPTEDQLREAAELVVEVSLLTGFPPDELFAPEYLHAHTRDRQNRAWWKVVVETVEDRKGFPAGSIVGHALIEPAVSDHLGGVTPGLVKWEKAGRLGDLGGLAVHPMFSERGIGSALIEARRVAAKKNGWALRALVWADSVSRVMYEKDPTWVRLGAYRSTQHEGRLVGYFWSPKASPPREQPVKKP